MFINNVDNKRLNYYVLAQKSPQLFFIYKQEGYIVEHKCLTLLIKVIKHLYNQ